MTREDPSSAPRIPVAEFVKSAWETNDWPPDGPPELAFVGRSNVGKSSLINTLVQRKNLVRTSSTPGRTRLLNFFRVELLRTGGERLVLSLVDLPGFGYAQVSKTERATWRPTLERYLGKRASLCAVVFLVDARRGAELEERELAPWIAARGVTVVPVLTKIDKVSKHARRPAGVELAQTLGLPPVLFSAVTGEGSVELWTRLLAAVAPTPPAT
jgi:GTP-binding protein